MSDIINWITNLEIRDLLLIGLLFLLLTELFVQKKSNKKHIF